MVSFRMAICSEVSVQNNSVVIERAINTLNNDNVVSCTLSWITEAANVLYFLL